MSSEAADPGLRPTGDVVVEKATTARGSEYTITRPANPESKDTGTAIPPGDNTNPQLQQASTASSAAGQANVVKAAGWLWFTDPDKPPFGMQVRWVAGGSSGWKTTTPEEEARSGITKYTITKIDNGDGSFRCELLFYNTKRYGYHFHDEEGDRYWVSTWMTGQHSLTYSSRKPDILFVTGD